ATRRTGGLSRLDPVRHRQAGAGRTHSLDRLHRRASAVLRARRVPPVAAHLPAGVLLTDTNVARPRRTTARRTVAACARLPTRLRCLPRFAVVAPGRDQW